MLLSLPIHLAHRRSAVALLLLRCRSVVAPLWHLYCSAAVAPLLRCCRTAIAPLSLRLFCSCCRYSVAPLSHQYCATVAPLLLLLLSLRCCAVVKPLLLRPREVINNSLMNCCGSTVTPLLLLLSIGRFTRLSPQEA